MIGHCRNGHPREGNTVLDNRGEKRCLVCRREWERRRRGPVITRPELAEKAERMISKVCEATGSSREWLTSSVRWHEVLLPRFAAFYVLHRQGVGYSAIGRAFRRDHTTVMNGVRRAEQLIANDRDFQKLVARLEQAA